MNKMTQLELLNFILEGIALIKRRCSAICSADDFLFNDANLDKFEATVMRLQTIGEALKNLEKRENTFLLQVASKEYWSEIMKLRDIISHHYSDIQAEIIFSICKDEIDALEEKILQLKELLL